jgi:integrase/recombinase XerC
MRLQDALDRFVVQLEADGRSPHTIAQYRRHIALLGRWLAQVSHSDDVDALSHEVLAQFLCAPDARTSRRGGVKKATSMNALRSSLRAFFGYVLAAGWSTENPARLVRRAWCAGPPPRGLGIHDRERLLATLASGAGPEARRDHMLFALMLATGMRLSAALALTTADVDLERCEIAVRHAKGDRHEVVYIGSAIRDHLAEYVLGRAQGPLFATKGGRPTSRRHAARRLSIWMQIASCRGRTSPHGLRHDFAMRLYGRTKDLLLVQRVLGHRSILSTMVYATCSRSPPDHILDELSQGH